MITFFYPFLISLEENFKNFVESQFLSTVISVCGNWWWSSFFLFWTKNTPFGNIDFKLLNLIWIFIYVAQFDYGQSFSRQHCVKSVSVRSYSGPHFSAFGLNTEKYGLSLHIQSECGKMRTRIALNTELFKSSKNASVSQRLLLTNKNE